MSSTDWGTTFETFAGDRAGLRDVSQEGGVNGLVDGVTSREVVPSVVAGSALRDEYRTDAPIPEGARVGAKVCRLRISAGKRAGTRRGRYFVPRSELERTDALALGVYTTSGGVIPEAFAMVPTPEISSRVGAWTDSTHPKYDEITRPPWGLIFDPDRLEAALTED